MDPVGDLESFAKLANEVEGAEITNLVMNADIWTFLQVLNRIELAYAPLPFRRRPTKRAARRLRGRIAEAMWRA